MSDVTPPAEESAPPRRFRRLRIGVSVFFGVLAVALCVLWARSDRWADELWLPLPLEHDIGITSVDACASIAIVRRDLRLSYPLGWSRKRDRHLKNSVHIRNPVPPSSIGFRIVHEHDYSLVYLNDWVLLLTLLGCAYLPWTTVGFSLRTLLIATTLVALVLGLVCFAVR
jgi:hypothetical protein